LGSRNAEVGKLNWDVGMRKWECSDFGFWNADFGFRFVEYDWYRLHTLVAYLNKIKNKCEAFGNYSAELRDINIIRYSQESMHT